MRSFVIPLMLIASVASAAPPDLQRLLRTGKYEDVLAATAKVATTDAQILARVDALRALGRDVEARTLLEPVALRSHPLRLAMAALFDDLGRRELATPLLEQFYDDHQAGQIDLKNAPDLTLLAIAARRLLRFHDANDTFRDATEVDPAYLPANLEWARMFLERYAAPEARKCLREVLARDPRSPEAHALMARVAWDAGDAEQARKEARAALAENPRLTEALTLLGELLLEEGDLPRAKVALEETLRINQSHLRANAALGAAALIGDDPPAYSAAVARAGLRGPRGAVFLHVVGEHLVKARRYADATRILTDAVAFDPTHPGAQAELGLALLRSGDETAGVAALRKAWDVDNFNVRTDNVLRLFEEVLPKSYHLETVGHFRIRATQRDRELLRRTIGPVLEDAYARYQKFYGVSPAGPVTVEIYDRQSDYAIRTIGLPDLAAVAVCFGRLITARSPAGGDTNFHVVVSHELAHTFAMALARERAPRWLMEGLAEWETARASPLWRRFGDSELGQIVERGELPTLVGMDRWFVRARSISEMMLGYRVAALAVEFIATRFGAASLPKLLAGLGQGATIASALHAATGMDLPALEAAFRAELLRRAAPPKGYHFHFPIGPPREALQKLRTGDLAGADQKVTDLLARDPRSIDGWALRGDLCLARKLAPCARAAFERVLALGGDGYDVRMRLALAARKLDDLPGAEGALNKASAFEPSRAEPLAELAALHRAAHRDDAELAALERLRILRPDDPTPLRRLGERYDARAQWKKSEQVTQHLLQFAPFDPLLHERLAHAYEMLGKTKDRLRELELAHLARARH